MDILINTSSPKPIYEQISQQIKGLILGGKLSPGDPLPSMRYLAKELRISIITTKRAYTDLEREGFVVTVTGKGTFVADESKDFWREEHHRKAEEYLLAAVEVAKEADIALSELHVVLDTLYKGE